MKNGIIFIHPDADETERFAAEELAVYLHRCADIETKTVIADRVGDDGWYIGSAFATLAPDAGTETPRGEGFAIFKTGASPVIAGGSPLGTLYGVYEYTERALGMLYGDPPYDEVETGKTDLSFPSAPYTTAPAFPFRGGNIHRCEKEDDFLHNIDRLGKRRMNRTLLFTPLIPLLKKHSGEFKKRGIEVTLGGHCFTYLFTGCGAMSTAAALEKYPEWHALVGGKRVRCEEAEGNFCFRSDGAVDYFIENVMKMLEDCDGCVDTLSLWPNDTGTAFCECDACRAHSTTDNILHLVNRVAAAVRARWQQMKVEMLAYLDFTAPPREELPGEGVVINFAPIYRDYRFPLYSVGRRSMQLFCELRDWCSLPGERDVFLYEYYRLDWMPKSTVIRSDFQDFRRIGAAGIMDDTFQSFNALDTVHTLGCNNYLQTKLLWNPDREVGELLCEVLTALYGPAAPAAREALERLEQLRASRNNFDLLWFHWLSRTVGVLRECEKKVAFTVAELCDVRDRLRQTVPSLALPFGGRMTFFADNVDFSRRMMECVLWQLRAQLTLRGAADAAAVNNALDGGDFGACTAIFRDAAVTSDCCCTDFEEELRFSDRLREAPGVNFEAEHEFLRFITAGENAAVRRAAGALIGRAAEIFGVDRPAAPAPDKLARSVEFYALPEEITRVLITIDRKERVRREEIMETGRHICSRILQGSGCLDCTTVPCPLAARLAPDLKFLG